MDVIGWWDRVSVHSTVSGPQIHATCWPSAVVIPADESNKLPTDSDFLSTGLRDGLISDQTSGSVYGARG